MLSEAKHLAGATEILAALRMPMYWRQIRTTRAGPYCETRTVVPEWLRFEHSPGPPH
jgi:hypothetical protein